MTLLAASHVPAADYAAVASEFSPDEVAALVSLVVTINAWNAIGVRTRTWEPGSYQPSTGSPGRRAGRNLVDHG